jgi:hypothetical protein
MKNFFLSTFLIILLIIMVLTAYLSTNGYETKKFNSIISKKIRANQPDLAVKVRSIKIKIDIRKAAIFLSTNNPAIVYQDISLPLSTLNIYIDFPSLFASRIQINTINFNLQNLNIINFKKLVTRIKPSNFKSFIMNNVSEGDIEGVFNLEFEKNLKLIDYQINGVVKNLDINLLDKTNIKNTNFNFLVDNEVIFLEAIKSNFKNIPINTGEIKIDRNNNLKITGKINTKLKEINENKIQELVNDFVNFKIYENKIKLSGDFLSKFSMTFSESLELKKYDFIFEGKQINSQIEFNNSIKIPLIKKEIKKIDFDKIKLNFDINKKNNNRLVVEGVYKFNNNTNYEKFKITRNLDKSRSDFNVDLNFSDSVDIEILNYKKAKNISANLSSIFTLINKKININNLDYKERKNSISVKGLKLDKNKNFTGVKSIKVNTYNENQEKNNFTFLFEDKILISGSKYDATNIIQLINSKNSNNYLKKVTKDIKISFKNIFTENNNKLKNFNLIGKIKDGKFEKILSKSEFGESKYLDITLKNDTSSNKKILEIFSDDSKPLLTNYSFFKDIKDGKLLFLSKFDKVESSASLTIEDFKVQNAPGFARLLSLADFGGVADLLSGEGLSFEILEIKFTNSEDVMRIEELYAIGPSISILIDGYVDNKSGLTSLKGTMIPAKDLNKLISKIPLLGKILVPKEIGEGIFGVSFKIKGMPGKLKTTVNPIKTLTPRFITKALEKRKK